MVSDEPCRVVVRVARELAAERHVAECEGRRGKRIDSDGDPTLVHVLERLLHRPRHLAYAVRLEGRCIRGRYEVMMDVDAVRLRARSTWGLRIRRTAWNERARAERSKPGEKLAALRRVRERRIDIVFVSGVFHASSLINKCSEAKRIYGRSEKSHFRRSRVGGNPGNPNTSGCPPARA